MRPLLLAALLLTSTFALPSAAAKPFAEDPSGDTAVSVFGQAHVPAQTPGADAVDLLSLEIAEDAEELTFALQVAKLDQAASFAGYAIHFSWKKDDYVVYVERGVVAGVLDDNSEAYLLAGDGRGRRWDAFALLAHEIDVPNNVITVYLPKAYILSDNGRFPLLGDDLTGVYVEAASHMTFFSVSTEAGDRMPDGDATLKYAFQYGDIAAGHVRLDADERVRVSNGGATTFVYKAMVENKGDLDDVFHLTISELPEGWNATVQSPLRLPAGAQRTIAVLVSVPFAHEHGGFSSFNLTATSENDPRGTASIRMGVLHTPIPQPAGHHSELYLHARNRNSGLFSELFPWTGASLNTDANHDGDAPEATPNGRGGGMSWDIPLDPVLRMGLDFDLDRVGTIAGSIVGHAAATGEIRAELYLTTSTTDEDGELVADGILLGETDSQPLTLDLNAPSAFSLTLTPTEDADYIPYERGQNLLLTLVFEDSGESFGSICCITGATPGLRTEDFKAVLPLNEYHDRLDGLAELGDLLTLRADGVVEKTGLPGTTMTYLFDITNHGPRAEVIDLDLAGTDADAGTLVPAASIELGPKETRKLTLAVTIPTGRNDGEELEVLVFAHAREDPSKSAIARTKTIVAKTGAAGAEADESQILLAAQEAEQNDTPGPGAGLALAAVALALLVARRRR